MEFNCLFLHHPFLNAKSLPVTTLLNRYTYHQSVKDPLHSVPKYYESPKSINKLTLNDQAIIISVYWIGSSNHRHLFMDNSFISKKQYWEFQNMDGKNDSRYLLSLLHTHIILYHVIS